MGQLLNKNLIIVGIGRVGLPLALVLANEGFNVVGVDVSTKLLETISKGHLPFTEEGAEPLLKKLYNNGFVVRHENELAKILSQSSAIILTLGTPMSDNFSPDVTQVTGFLEKFSSHFKKKQLLVLRSTVTPGTTEYIDRYLLEKYNWKVGKDLYLAYCPERIAEGKAVE